MKKYSLPYNTVQISPIQSQVTEEIISDREY